MSSKQKYTAVKLAATVIVILIAVISAVIIRRSYSHDDPYVKAASTAEALISDASLQDETAPQVTEDGDTDAASDSNETADDTQSDAEYAYVLNTGTKKIHSPSCPYAKRIKAENYAVSNESRDALIAQGYTVCKKCG